VHTNVKQGVSPVTSLLQFKSVNVTHNGDQAMLVEMEVIAVVPAAK
jgi:hypothetical protein